MPATTMNGSAPPRQQAADPPLTARTSRAVEGEMIRLPDQAKCRPGLGEATAMYHRLGTSKAGVR
ncbi:hypothetical protein [Streptomyces sp. 3N207]|uniref:hypothetical protein n=1 Tax=Streptomyces sp. 3N207 TaxID=3457417 RepID=UPI003FD5135E